MESLTMERGTLVENYLQTKEMRKWVVPKGILRMAQNA